MVTMHQDTEVFKGNLFSAPMDHPLAEHVGRICFIRRRSRGFKDNSNGFIKEWENDGTVTVTEGGLRILNSFGTDRPQHFIVGHLQKDYRGKVCLRVYQCDKDGNQEGYNNFGECAHLADVVWKDELN